LLLDRIERGIEHASSNADYEISIIFGKKKRKMTSTKCPIMGLRYRYALQFTVCTVLDIPIICRISNSWYNSTPPLTKMLDNANRRCSIQGVSKRGYRIINKSQ